MATRQRVTMALGQDKASKLEAYLNTEATMDALRKALGNSTTTRQLATLGWLGDWVDWAERWIICTAALSRQGRLLAWRWGIWQDRARSRSIRDLRIASAECSRQTIREITKRCSHWLQGASGCRMSSMR
jgi:hypothetical protein